MEASQVAAVVRMVAECLDAEDYDEHEGIAEESVAELMSQLELEIKLAAGGRANALPLPPQGNESRGPSLAGPPSTVMASEDGRAGAPPAPHFALPWPGTWPVPVLEPAALDCCCISSSSCTCYCCFLEADVDDEWVSQL